ncbi:MAG: ABC transporter permease [Gemmatimonadota bacterium]
MRIGDDLVLALRQLRQDPLKAAFGLTSVTVGILFLVVVVGVVEGIDRYVTEDFAAEVYGLNTLQIRSTPSVQVGAASDRARLRRERPRLTQDEAQTLRESLTVEGKVGVESSLSASVHRPQGARAEGVRVSAVSEEIFRLRRLDVVAGRAFSPQEAERGVAVAVIGVGVADALFPEDDPLEERIRINGLPFRVVGVLEEQGTLLGQTRDNRILVPARSPIIRAFPDRSAVHMITVGADDPSELLQAVAEAEVILRSARGLRPGQPNDFELETADASLAFWDNIARVLFFALPGLVGIALVVGGIVIMNIMLMSVVERTREIGVRMAIGARRSDVVRQFLMEAVLISGLGALLGTVVGSGAIRLIHEHTPLPAAVALPWLLLGVGLGVTVGVLAGVYPAIHASRMDPVEALRYE